MKKNRIGKITHVGGNWGKSGEYILLTEDYVLAHIDRVYKYYVNINNSDVKITVAKHGHTSYLRTDPAHSFRNNLGNLPQCE